MTKKLTIALDGPAASGKSTTAKLLAKKLDYIYIDTGAMYRAVALVVLESGMDLTDSAQSVKIAEQSEITLKLIEGNQHTFLNGEDVSDKIRTPQIDVAVSQIASNAHIRKIMVKLQQAMASEGGVVMDGRDIGTVILPDADLKVFMQASIEARAKRRLKDQANHNLTLEEIRKDIERRDHADMSRKESPLKQAADALLLDNSNMTIDQQVEKIIGWTKQL